MKKWLSEALLFWFAIAWLGLAFVPMLVLPNHSISLMEPNLGILSIEISICVFAIAWSVVKFRQKTRKHKHET